MRRAGLLCSSVAEYLPSMKRLWIRTITKRRRGKKDWCWTCRREVQKNTGKNNGKEFSNTSDSYYSQVQEHKQKDVITRCVTTKLTETRVLRKSQSSSRGQ